MFFFMPKIQKICYNKYRKRTTSKKKVNYLFFFLEEPKPLFQSPNFRVVFILSVTKFEITLTKYRKRTTSKKKVNYLFFFLEEPKPLFQSPNFRVVFILSVTKFEITLTKLGIKIIDTNSV